MKNEKNRRLGCANEGFGACLNQPDPHVAITNSWPEDAADLWTAANQATRYKTCASGANVAGEAAHSGWIDQELRPYLQHKGFGVYWCTDLCTATEYTSSQNGNHDHKIYTHTQA